MSMILPLSTTAVDLTALLNVCFFPRISSGANVAQNSYSILLKMSAFTRKLSVKEALEMLQKTNETDSGDDGETDDGSWILESSSDSDNESQEQQPPAAKRIRLTLFKVLMTGYIYEILGFIEARGKGIIRKLTN